ncbi:uncharacterized protein LOC114129844 [Aphis gossypii]|uniref:Uncharacterized protein n=1 Tax=Aphis gossypii TaxID=80765 RepID=A0A9P0ILF7_APHGO|nr:uncharacterized protein LOC114129844 [Aphis gossypii]CAH1710384.1 unnamed protein product [Aphis gossypii]
MSGYTVYAIFTVAVAVTITAIMQPDEVGPAGMFEKSVSEMMARDKDMTRDVAEMLVAAQSLGNVTAEVHEDDDCVAAQIKKLNRALAAMDAVQRTGADEYDRCYDYFLDLYPLWRMYLLCEDHKHKKSLLRRYKSLLARYNRCCEALIRDLGVLVALEKALLPSNAYADPDNRILPSEDTAAVLDNF